VRLRGFRIVKARLAKDAFTGEGAQRYGGRWNSPGLRAIYVASTASLAMLEMLVHMQSRELLLKYVLFPVEFDDTLVTELDPSTLPSDWRASPAPPTAQAVGDRWIASGSSAVLRVSSAIVDSESNYVINPEHADFGKIKIGKKQQIAFDQRLK